MGEDWQYIDDPIDHVLETNGLLDEKAEGTGRTEASVQADNKILSTERKAEVDEATLPKHEILSWSVYEEEVEAKANHSKNEKS
jgi:Mn-containing catalase